MDTAPSHPQVLKFGVFEVDLTADLLPDKHREVLVPHLCSYPH